MNKLDLSFLCCNEKFLVFLVALCIKGSILFFHVVWVSGISPWKHINDHSTVLILLDIGWWHFHGCTMLMFFVKCPLTTLLWVKMIFSTSQPPLVLQISLFETSWMILMTTPIVQNLLLLQISSWGISMSGSGMWTTTRPNLIIWRQLKCWF